MIKYIRHFQFLFDYYVGYMVTNGNKMEAWSENIKKKYPEKFKTKIDGTTTTNETKFQS